MTTTPTAEPAWVAAACTLPTAEVPLRLAEFDALFAAHVRQVHRPDATGIVLALTGDPAVAAFAANLASARPAAAPSSVSS